MILLSVLRLAFSELLQRLNAVKNVLVGVANAVASLLFIAAGEVAWEAAALIAGGSIAGAWAGGTTGAGCRRRLRRVVIVGGTIVSIILIVD